ncbi:MAG: hypothetical protein K9H26_01720 [Prolixibacteraceae bacterium]|nr:hypothetical protein [Prolixibacteraceae bacterium]
MKQVVLYPIVFVFIFSFIVPFNTFSYNTENNTIICEFDESEIYSAFNEIEEQLAYIQQNENITYTGLIEAGYSTDNIANESSAVGAVEQFRFDSQTSFLMGCLFGGVGILAVALVNEGDTTALNSSLWGCATTSIVGVLSVVGVYGCMFAYFGFYL